MFENARLFAFSVSCRSRKIENVRADVKFIGNFCCLLWQVCTCSIPVLVSLKMDEAGTSMRLGEYCETRHKDCENGTKTYRFGQN